MNIIYRGSNFKFLNYLRLNYVNLST